MNCFICDDNIKNDDNYIFENDQYCCLKCNDVRVFLEDKPKKKEKIITQQPEKKTVCFYSCMKCGLNYEGMKCNNCGMNNPLFIKKKKKKRR